jgi:hypothetical protein
MAVNFCHILQVTVDETWVLFVDVETEKQSKQWMLTHSPDKPKRCKQTLFARKPMVASFPGPERSAEGGIHATKGHSYVKCIAKHQKTA